jgi:hypothetical protein
VLDTQCSSLLDATEETWPSACGESAAQWSIAMTTAVDADAVRIFHALTLPEYLEAWISMPGHAEDSAVIASPAENGYRLDQYAAGSLAVSITGSYLFCHHRKMRLSWRKSRKAAAFESLVDFRLRGNFGSTLLELRHTALGSADEYRWHQTLWSRSLDKLASLLKCA